MKTKKQSKRVENLYSYRVAEVTLFVEQKDPERGVSVSLNAIYRVAYTDHETLSNFVLSIKSDPTKYFKSHFRFRTPIVSKVSIDHIDDEFYSIGCNSLCKQLLIVNSSVGFRCQDALNHNRSIIQYREEI